MSDCKHLRVGFINDDWDNPGCWCDVSGFELSEWENKCEQCNDFEEE